MTRELAQLRLAVVGHVEHVALGQVAQVPRASEIVHLEGLRELPGGGGGVALFQMRRGGSEVHAFTALGRDEAAVFVASRMAEAGIHLHAARRDAAHTRDVVLITPDGERTIVVLGQPLHPRRDDALPWELLAGCDAAYFTAEDPQALQAARAARLLVVSARRRRALAESGVRADVVVGSAVDPRERSGFADYPVSPGALVMTEGARGGTISTARGVLRFPPGPAPERVVMSYGAGDSFAGALTAYLAAGLDMEAACARAAKHGAAVLAGPDPLSAQLALRI